MKSLKFLVAISLVFVCIASKAQTTKKLFLKSYDNSLFNYGSSTTMTTTDSAVNTILTITPASDQGGIIEVTVLGWSDSVNASVTGSKIVRYNKAAGTLTLGSATAVLASATDTNLGTATWNITTSSNSIIVTVKGKLDIPVLWKVVVRHLYNYTPS